jgi:hypothetical protein
VALDFQDLCHKLAEKSYKVGASRLEVIAWLFAAIDLEIPYFSRLEAAYKLILQDPSMSSLPERPSSQFIRAARFLKKNARHVFQIRDMGAASENRMDRCLWDFLDSNTHFSD